MNDTPGDELRDALQRMSGAVRPTVGAADTIHAGVRRSRRRRALGTVVGTAGLVMAVAAGGYALAASDTGPRQVQPAPADSSLSPSAPAADELFECATEHPVFTRATPPVPDLAEQQRTVQQLYAMSSVQVRHAAPTRLGVVALVVDDSGDPDSYAEPDVVAQLRAAGASHVYEWDPSIASAGVDADGQVRQVLQWRLDPAIGDVRRATRGVPGDAGLALWTDAGAVLLQWKAPIPQEVLALAGVRPDGVEVIVEPVAHSRQDVTRAQERLQSALRELGLLDRFSSASACGDGSGLIVGLVPPITDRAALQADLSEALGLPVMVIHEERPLPLGLPLKD
ncbi:MAG: hypothetical protein Q8O61_17460 [Nocardioides sp.]|nr:hypothetical protein [Nocardioides sp.]